MITTAPIARIIDDAAAQGFELRRASELQPEAAPVFNSGEFINEDVSMATVREEWQALISEFEAYRAAARATVTPEERNIVMGLTWLNAQLNHIGKPRVVAICSGEVAGTEAERRTIEEFKSLRKQAIELGLTGERLAVVKSVCEYEIDLAFNSQA